MSAVLTIKRDDLLNQFCFADGTRLRQLSPTSFEQVDLLGKHIRYLRAEHVTIEPSLMEQRVQRLRS